jgi:hypothetical protein
MGFIFIEQINLKYKIEDVLTLKKDFFSFVYLGVVFVLATYMVYVSPPFKLK